MGIVSALRCPKCGKEPASKIVFRCPSCESILEVNVKIGHLTRADLQAMSQSPDRSIWRWFDFFPVESRTSIVSLGAELNITRLYLKNDTVLPTGSLKDRSNSVGISKAKELGFTIATVMSTGN